MHPCERIYEIAGQGFSVGTTKGVCRIIGKESIGMPFKKWVKDTFTNHDQLKPGTIISNQAAFCFVEDSKLIQQKQQRDKPQKFRTYSHIIYQGEWLCVTKADKQRIVVILQGMPELVCLTDSGQKHVFFKHRPGLWQLDDTFVEPNLPLFNHLHGTMMELLACGFTQAEVITGNYAANRILTAGIERWKQLENKIKSARKTPMFDFASWLMYSQSK